MTSIRQLVINARREEKTARAQWLVTLDEFQERSTPSNIAGEAWEGIQGTVGNLSGKVVEAAKKRPATAAAVGSALVLLLFRKRIASAIGSRIARRSERKETEQAGEALHSRTDPAPAPERMMTEETGR